MSAVKPGYVYFLHAVNSADRDGLERYKIGLTTRYVDDRLKELNSGQSPYWLVEKWAIQVSDCEAVEAALHKHFASRRLYFNTSNGTTAKCHEIDSADRKSTEWFMFSDAELPSVEESYENIRQQYEWQMLPPNKRERSQQRNDAQQVDRQWQQTADRVLHNDNSSDGFGWVLAFAVVAVVLFPSVGKMGNFTKTINQGGSDSNFKLPSLPPIPSIPTIDLKTLIPSLALPFNQPEEVKVKAIANLRRYVDGQSQPIKTGKTIARGIVLKVRMHGDWAVIDDGEAKGLLIHRSMIDEKIN